jgi:hypothetical protein
MVNYKIKRNKEIRKWYWSLSGGLKSLERLAVRKWATQKVWYGEIQFQKLNEVEDKGQYRVEISNRLAALENTDADVDINRVRETIREYINFS